MKAAFLSFSIVTLVAISSAPTTTRAQGVEVLKASARLPKLPLIGDKAAEFEAESTQGKIRFPQDYAGKWVILFSHPADFTPVCTSEFVVFASMAGDFEKLNAKLLGLSIGEVDKHKQWVKAIKEKIEYLGFKNQEIPFPIIADHDQEVAWAYGMLHPTVSSTQTVRAVFIIDPQGVIRAYTYYPPEAGRNISEIKRLLIAIQTAEAHQVATPANWEPGEDVLVKEGQKDAGAKCQDWYFCLKPLDKSRLTLP